MQKGITLAAEEKIARNVDEMASRPKLVVEMSGLTKKKVQLYDYYTTDCEKEKKGRTALEQAVRKLPIMFQTVLLSSNFDYAQGPRMAPQDFLMCRCLVLMMDALNIQDKKHGKGKHAEECLILHRRICERCRYLQHAF